MGGDEAGAPLGGGRTLEEQVGGASPGAHKKTRQVLSSVLAMTPCLALHRSMPDSSSLAPGFDKRIGLIIKNYKEQ